MYMISRHFYVQWSYWSDTWYMSLSEDHGARPTSASQSAVQSRQIPEAVWETGALQIMEHRACVSHCRLFWHKAWPKVVQRFPDSYKRPLDKNQYLVCPTMLHHSSLYLSGFCECWCLLIRRHGCRCCTCCAGSATFATVAGQQLDPSEAWTSWANFLMLGMDGGENTRHCKSDQITTFAQNL